MEMVIEVAPMVITTEITTEEAIMVTEMETIMEDINIERGFE